MNNFLFYIGVNTASLDYARAFLNSHGCAIASEPTNSVTHLLLNVPAFAPDGTLAGGGNLTPLLQNLPNHITIVGGNLNAPTFQNYNTIDLLQNEAYLAENAAITADCALRIAYQHFPAVMRGTTVLILGWGRIAKCLTQLLSVIGAQVTVAARKESDLVIARALGYNSIPFSDLQDHLPGYRIIFNTVPAMVLPATLSRRSSDCLKIDLASTPGIEGEDVIIARGLPGKLAPESAGNLIGKATLELTCYKEVSS